MNNLSAAKENNLITHIKENIICWIMVVVATIVTHASMLFGGRCGIDTEAMYYYGRDFYQGWLNSGRYGLLLTKIVTFGMNFNPYVCGVLTIIFLLLACVLWTYLYRCVCVGRNSTLGNIVFSLIIIVHTIITEQIYFIIQSAEIAFAFALMAVSILITYNLFVSNNESGDKINQSKVKTIITLFIALLLNLWVFSTYQVMIPLYIFGVVSVLYLHCVMDEESIENHYWILSFKFAGLFIVSFIINEVITLTFFNGSSYINNQIFWGKLPLSTCIYQIASHVARAGILGRRIYFAPTYVIYVVLFILITIKLLKGREIFRDKKRAFFAWILVLFAIIAPFYMTIICGGEPVIRSQLVLPFAIAFMGYVSICMCPDMKKVIAIVIVATNIITVSEQCVMTIRLNYTDKVRYEQDVKMSMELIDRIDEYQNADKSMPVVFIGKKPAKLEGACISTGDVIGFSFYDWDTDPEPYSYHSTLRVIGFMSTLGTTYTEPDTGRMADAYEYSVNMKSYPDDGCIDVYDGMIIVKLSDR